MASWKKVLTDGDNTNVANSNLTQASGDNDRSYTLGTSGARTLKFLPSSGVAPALTIGSSNVTLEAGNYVDVPRLRVTPVGSTAGKLVLYDGFGPANSGGSLTIKMKDSGVTDYTLQLPASISNSEVRDVLRVTDIQGTEIITAFAPTETVYLNISNLSSAGAYSGETLEYGSMAAGATYTAGGLYILTSTGWDYPDMTSPSNVNLVNGLLGVAVGTSPTSGGFLLSGVYRPANGSSLTQGAPVYVDSATTPRGVTGTAPSGVGDYVRIIGHCIQTTGPVKIAFNPSPDYILIE